MAGEQVTLYMTQRTYSGVMNGVKYRYSVMIPTGVRETADYERRIADGKMAMMMYSDLVKAGVIVVEEEPFDGF